MIFRTKITNKYFRNMDLFMLILCALATCVLSAPPKKNSVDLPVVYETEEPPPSDEIPDSVLIQMRDLKSATDFWNFVNQPDKSGRPVAGNETTYISRKRPLGADVLKDIAPAAGCIPETKAIKLPSDRGVITWPDCTRLQRCGGCCPSQLLECIPLHVTKVNLKVLQVRYMGTKFETMSPKEIVMEQHDNCTCACKEKESDCGPAQVYKPNECLCVCKDITARAKCKSHDRYWDNRDCVCKCKEVDECSTGLQFNNVRCRCELLGRRSNLATPIGRLAGLPLVRDDGGERDGHVERYVGIRPVDDVGPFTMARKQGSTVQRRRQIKVPVTTTKRP